MVCAASTFSVSTLPFSTTVQLVERVLPVVLFLAAHRHTSIVRLYVGINQDEISIEETYASLSEPMRQTYESLSYVVSVRLIAQSKTERTEYVSIILSLHADPHTRQVGDAD